MENSEQIKKAAEFISKKIGKNFDSAVILGSGLGSALPFLEDEICVQYKKIPGFASPAVPGHDGSLVAGRYFGKRIIALKGRFHYYEGHKMDSVILPVRILKLLGVKNLIITAAAGQINPSMKKGTLVILRDHINFMGASPLRGTHDPKFGERFPDMSCVYDKQSRRIAMEILQKNDICSAEGVYVAVAGPSYETPAEINAFGKLGADIVGMSVVPEAIAAHQMGMKVLGVSYVANEASAPQRKITHEDVLKEGKIVLNVFRKLLAEVLKIL